MSERKKKKLTDRVTWIKFLDIDAFCFHGGVSVQLKRWHRRGQWEVTSLGGCFIVEARTLSAAKARALEEVQRRIREAAKEWGD